MALVVSFGDHSGLVLVKNTVFELPVQYPAEFDGAQIINSQHKFLHIVYFEVTISLFIASFHPSASCATITSRTFRGSGSDESRIAPGRPAETATGGPSAPISWGSMGRKIRRNEVMDQGRPRGASEVEIGLSALGRAPGRPI